MSLERYSKQMLFPRIGREGQEKLNNSFAVVIGCGALGSVSASALVRAGVGRIKIIDRDFIEYHNLQRQILFTEKDILDELPKAIAAERHLKEINSSVDIQGIVADVNHTNIEKFVKGASVIIDGLDNFETRYLINDVSLKFGIPWVYGGVLSSLGMTMTLVPGKTPCLRCFLRSPFKAAQMATCDTVGILGQAPWVIGSIQAVEAIKILVGSDEINHHLILLDVWEDYFNRVSCSPVEDCPACNGKYEFLEGVHGIKATSLCGQHAVQVINNSGQDISFEVLAERLSNAGIVSYNQFMLHFLVDSREIIVFPDGRAIIKNTDDEGVARNLYAKYIGV